MLLSKFKKINFVLALLILLPNYVFALQMPKNANDLANAFSLNAKAYLVMDAKTGQILIDKNANLPWTPASLTKLVTALVVLDSKTKLTKSVAITASDQTLGACNAGGACIRANVGVRFSVDGLFHAMLLPSANNAASALARSTGMSIPTFAAKMNAKAKSLGAIDSHFNEPTGMDPSNSITASDYAKIVNAAFGNSYLRSIAALNSYRLHSLNNSKYNQTLKNTDKLLKNSDIQILGAKTGYLDESAYNFAALLKYKNGPLLSVVVLGETHLYSAFSETALLASIVEQAQNLASENSTRPIAASAAQVSALIIK